MTRFAFTLVTTFNPKVRNQDLFVEAVCQLAGNNDFLIELIVVDDFNQADTESLKSGLEESRRVSVRLVRNLTPMGQVKSLLEGARMAKHEAILVMDPDMHANIPDIPNFIDACEGAEIVLGVREQRMGVSLARKCASRLFSIFFSVLTGIKVKDYTSPMCMFKKGLIADMDMTTIKPGEIKSAMLRRGAATMKEVSIKVDSRGHESNYSMKSLLVLGANEAFYVLKQAIEMHFQKSATDDK